jgi:hypothetical protein
MITDTFRQYYRKMSMIMEDADFELSLNRQALAWASGGRNFAVYLHLSHQFDRHRPHLHYG